MTPTGATNPAHGATNPAHGDPRHTAVLGSGGREHAIVRQLARSTDIARLFCLPGNAGTDALAENVTIDSEDPVAVAKFCRQNGVGFVVIGPEAPLAAGVADTLREAGVVTFGPGRAAARLESDKAFAKNLMRQQAVPTAEARAFTRPEPAEAYVEKLDGPCVVKAAGLAGGKGVTICRDADAARVAIDRLLRQKTLGDAGATVVVEEMLRGPECSVMALIDRREMFVLDPAQDHKTLHEHDTGPMTGGMGAYTPASWLLGQRLTPATIAQIERDVFIPVLDGLLREGIEYQGVLYAGLMLTDAGPKVLEFNVRFGDPEAQPTLARFQGDLLAVLHAVATGRMADLDPATLAFDPRPAVCVVAAAAGYPEKPRTGDLIEGTDAAERIHAVTVDHAATARDAQGRLVTAGGRVLSVTAVAETLAGARDTAYAAIDSITFPGKQTRRDIAAGA